MLRPIPGAPPGSPIPVPERSVGDHELAEWLAALRSRWQYDGKVALESRIEAVKLLKYKYAATGTHPSPTVHTASPTGARAARSTLTTNGLI